MLIITSKVEDYSSIDREKFIDDYVKDLSDREFWHFQKKIGKSSAVFSNAWDEEEYTVDSHVASLSLEVVMNFLQIELKLEEFSKTESDIFAKFYRAFETSFSNQKITTNVSLFYKRSSEFNKGIIKQSETFEIETYNMNELPELLMNYFF